MQQTSPDDLCVRWSADRAGRLVAGGVFLLSISLASGVLNALYTGHNWLFYALSGVVLPVGAGAVRLGLRRSDRRAVALAVSAQGLDLGASRSIVVPWARVRSARVVTLEQDHEVSRFLCVDIVGAEALSLRGRSFVEKALSGFVPDEPPLTFFERDVDVDVASLEAAINARSAARRP